MTTSQSPLAYRDFRLFWIARFSAIFATMAMVVVIGWQVYDIARSDYGMTPKQAAFQLGLIGIAQFLPLLLLTPIAGWVADKFERRLIARLANLIDMACAAILAVMSAQDTLTLPILFGLAAFHGVARVFVGPAMSAIAPNLVPPAVLPQAIAMNSIAWQSASVGGPALGGLLYAINPASPYWFSVGALGVAIIALSLIKPIAPPVIKGNAHPLQQMVDGVRYVGRERFLLGAITLDLFAVLLAGATALLPVYARDILHVGPQGLGQLRAAPALGAAVLALWFTFRPLKNNVGIKMLWAVIVFGLATIAFGLSESMLLSLSMLVLLGAADMLSVYVRSSLVQLNTPDEMRGRVSAVSNLAISGSNELGEAQSGVAAALLGPVGAVVFGGIGAICVTMLWARLFPELRNARTFEPIIKDQKT
jgi:MFS family permease